nr:EAL domain-containing protein [Methylomarinum sp. Ch1-1]MDP4521751.1 EAL domain-containing protein [Methylomarinum sp. Ch1-1]
MAGVGVHANIVLKQVIGRLNGCLSAKKIHRLLLAFLLLNMGCVDANPQKQQSAPEKVTVQLRYFHQFQFAGFYAAIAQGYYRDAGLEVDLVQPSLASNSIDQVLLGNAQYGQTQVDLLYYRLHGKPLVALAPIFQHSPSVLLVRKDSGIRSPHDLKGKRVMLELGDHATSIIAMLKQEGVQLEDLDIVKQSYGVEELLSRQVDAVGVYLTNRPFELKQRGVGYHILNPLNYGIDFYGDTLYTTEEEIKRHPDRVRRFRAATLRGWRYAMAHPDEIIDLLIEQYGVNKSREHLQFEAAAIRRLIMPDLIEIGHANPRRWRRMADILVSQGLAPQDGGLNGFIYRQPEPWYRKYPAEYYYGALALLTIALIGALYYWRLSRALKVQIAARQQAEADSLRLGDILEHSLNEIYIFDAETLLFIQVNDAARKNLGYSMEELTALTPLDLKPDFMPAQLTRMTEMLKAGLGKVVFETVHKRKDGSLYPVEVDLQYYNDERQPFFYALINDVTERKVYDEKIKRMTHLYQTLHQVNHAILTISNEDELFQEICRITVEFGHLELAWIGVVSEQESIVPVAVVGERQEYTRQISISVNAELPEGQGPTAKAYHSGNIVVCNDFLHDPTTAPWHEQGSQHQWASSCAIPISRQRDVYAVLNVYTSLVDYFDEEIVQLFVEMKNDLNFALDAYDREITRRRAEEDLKLAAKVFQQSRDAILISDQNNAIICVNRAFTEITGFSEAEVLGQNPHILSSGRHDRDFYRQMWQMINENNYWQGEIWNRRKNGELFPEWMTISGVKDSRQNITHYIGIFSDITEYKESEARIEHLAHYDPLTDLPNRILFKAYVDHELTVSERQHQPFALLFLDLDHFQNINDSLGHSVGDQLLLKVSERLKQALREEDAVARLGGDEFNVLLPNTDFRGAAHVADNMIHIIAQPIEIDQYQLHVRASIGISLYPENGEDYETLSKNADTAMFQCKQKGRNQFAFFTEAMQQAAMRRMEIEHDLRQAMEKSQLQVYYQPQVDAGNGKIIGAEALLRWHHPEWGMVSPAEFIPVAEECGLILPIGGWVLEQAVAQAANWQRAGFKPICIAVNLSMAQFKENTLYQTIRDSLERHQLSPHYLELELTESIAMHNAEYAVDILRRLKGLGIQLAIDDFGTGYSSLSYLQRFALDKLKIDRSFIKNMMANKDSENIVDSIIGLAKSLRLRTIAEVSKTIPNYGCCSKNIAMSCKVFI